MVFSAWWTKIFAGYRKWRKKACYSFLAGFGWAAMALGIISLFEKKSWKYILISWGYVTVAFLLKGLILGLWQ